MKRKKKNESKEERKSGIKYKAPVKLGAAISMGLLLNGIISALPIAAQEGPIGDIIDQMSDAELEHQKESRGEISTRTQSNNLADILLEAQTNAS